MTSVYFDRTDPISFENEKQKSRLKMFKKKKKFERVLEQHKNDKYFILLYFKEVEPTFVIILFLFRSFQTTVVFSLRNLWLKTNVDNSMKKKMK